MPRTLEAGPYGLLHLEGTMDLFAGKTRAQVEAMSEWAPLANALEPLQDATPYREAEVARELEQVLESADCRGLRPKEAAELMAAHCVRTDDPKGLERLVQTLTEELAAACRREPAGSIDLMGYAQAMPAEVPAESVPFPVEAYYWWWRSGQHPGLWPAAFRPSVFGWPDPGAEDVPERVRRALQSEGVQAQAVKVPATDDERLARIACWLDKGNKAYNPRFAALVAYMARVEAEGVQKCYGRNTSHEKDRHQRIAEEELQRHGVLTEDEKGRHPADKDVERFMSFFKAACNPS